MTCEQFEVLLTESETSDRPFSTAESVAGVNHIMECTPCKDKAVLRIPALSEQQENAAAKNLILANAVDPELNLNSDFLRYWLARVRSQ